MRYPYSQIKSFTILLLAVKFISPLYGQVYFSELLNAVESSHTEYVCVQKGGGSSHESQESPQHIIQCHELEQPGLIASDLIIHYSPAISTLASSEKDAILLGYRFPIKIPQKTTFDPLPRRLPSALNHSCNLSGAINRYFEFGIS